MALSASKSPFKSVTIVSAAIAAGASLLGAAGIQLAPDVLPQINNVIAGVASIFAIYGRFRAKDLIL